MQCHAIKRRHHEDPEAAAAAAAAPAPAATRAAGGNTHVTTDLAGSVPHHESPDAKSICAREATGDLWEKTTILLPPGLM
jgi:hypothetical protein